MHRHRRRTDWLTEKLLAKLKWKKNCTESGSKDGLQGMTAEQAYRNGTRDIKAWLELKPARDVKAARVGHQ